MVRKTKKKGGEFLGEGTYGCVFRPAPVCASSETPMEVKKQVVPQPDPSKTIAKVFHSIEDANDEWAKAYLMAQADPEQKYFLYATSQCETMGTMIHQDTTARKCRNVSAQNLQQSYPVLKMPFGGITISDFIKTNRVLPLADFLHYMSQVFEGLVLLSKNGLVHQDLKFDNILVNPTEKRASIIDIGLLIRARNAHDPTQNEFLFSGYWLHPPEYRVCDFLLNITNVPLTKETARTLLKNELKILNVKFSSQDKQPLAHLITHWLYDYCDYDQEYVQFILGLKKYNSAQTAIQSLAKTANTIDVYSVGITMIYLTQFMNPVIFQRSPAYQNLLQMCLHPNPRRRYTPAQALKHIKLILTS